MIGKSKIIDRKGRNGRKVPGKSGKKPYRGLSRMNAEIGKSKIIDRKGRNGRKVPEHRKGKTLTTDQH